MILQVVRGNVTSYFSARQTATWRRLVQFRVSVDEELIPREKIHSHAILKKAPAIVTHNEQLADQPF
jgi:hypothetical protein